MMEEPTKDKLKVIALSNIISLNVSLKFEP